MLSGNGLVTAYCLCGGGAGMFWSWGVITGVGGGWQHLFVLCAKDLVWLLFCVSILYYLTDRCGNREE